jgi:hypothetical protein
MFHPAREKGMASDYREHRKNLTLNNVTGTQKPHTKY